MIHRKTRALTALLLALLLLFGCADPLPGGTSAQPTAEPTVEATPTPAPTVEPLGEYVPQPARRADVRMMDMEYVRPDAQAYIQRVEEFLPLFAAADTPKEQLRLYLEMEAHSQQVSDMLMLAEVQFMLDVTPETQAESDYCTEFSAEVHESNIKIYRALLDSPFVEEFRRYFGEDVLEGMQVSVAQYDPQIVSIMEQVDKLGSEYTRIAKEHEENRISFQGEELTAGDALSMLAYNLTPGTTDYKRLENSLRKHYDALNQDCDAIYAQIIELSNQAASLAGFESYPAYYLQSGSYSLEEIRAYVQDIRDAYIPLLESMLSQGEEILGMPLTPLFYYVALCPPMLDIDYAYINIEDSPEMQEEQECIAASEILHALLPEAGELMEYLEETQMLDVLSAPGKSAGAFSTFFYGISQPYIYSDAASATTIIHEAGHALNSYSMPDIDITERYSSGTEVREVHSMGLEVLAYQEYSTLYGDTADNAIYSHLFEGLLTLLTQTMYYEFELTCYDNPDMTRQERNQLYADLANEYGLAIPTLTLYTEDGLTWVDTLHFFQSPLYTIDYTLAQCAAYQIWEIQQQDPEKAKQVYMDFLLDNQETDLRERLKNAGLDDVFDRNNLMDLADRLEEMFLSDDYMKPLLDLMKGLNAA